MLFNIGHSSIQNFTTFVVNNYPGPQCMNDLIYCLFLQYLNLKSYLEVPILGYIVSPFISIFTLFIEGHHIFFRIQGIIKK